MNIAPKNIIEYWFSEPARGYWFSSTPEFDEDVTRKYQSLWEKASMGELDDWSHDSDGCLALVIILDQFPLNMFRGKAKSFKTEKRAIQLARSAVDKGLDQPLDKEKRAFLYMPFMHSENLMDQDLSVQLYIANGVEANISFAKHHREIIRQFGRFPHRNEILGRSSSAEEINYLASKQAFKG